MDYPAAEDENELARLVAGGEPPERRLAEELRVPVLQAGELEQLQAAVGGVRVSEAITGYIVNLSRQTRQHAAVWVGAGPRGTLALLSASRALAALEERDFVLPEDVKKLAAPVLEHRMVLRPEFEMEGVQIREVINSVLEAVEVPREFLRGNANHDSCKYKFSERCSPRGCGSRSHDGTSASRPTPAWQYRAANLASPSGIAVQSMRIAGMDHRTAGCGGVHCAMVRSRMVMVRDDRHSCGVADLL